MSIAVGILLCPICRRCSVGGTGISIPGTVFPHPVVADCPSAETCLRSPKCLRPSAHRQPVRQFRSAENWSVQKQQPPDDLTGSQQQTASLLVLRRTSRLSVENYRSPKLTQTADYSIRQRPDLGTAEERGLSPLAAMYRDRPRAAAALLSLRTQHQPQCEFAPPHQPQSIQNDA